MRCRDHEETMHLLAGDGYVCLSCERGDPPITRGGRPMSVEFETKDDFEQALADFEEKERQRRGAERVRSVRRGDVREPFHR
jgi:hypothetical protein